MNSHASEIVFKSNKVLITGDINNESYLKFKAIVDDNPGVDEVVLMSNGGSILAGMAIGKIIKSKNIDIRVIGICGSSCANYIFIAGNKKTLTRDALVFFHGGAQEYGLADSVRTMKNSEENKTHGVRVHDDGDGPPPDYILDATGIKKVNSLEEALPAIIEAEKKYFLTMGVVNELATYGQAGIYADLWQSKKYQAFYYDLESLNRLGIKNVLIEGGQWHPEENPAHGYIYKVKYP